MSDERTRTTSEVRDGYAYDGYSGESDPYYELRFDRWLTAHDAETRTAALEAKNAEISALKEKWQGKTANDWVEIAIASEAEMVRLRKVFAEAVEALTDLRYDLFGSPWFSRVTEIRSILDFVPTKATVAAEEGTNA